MKADKITEGLDNHRLGSDDGSEAQITRREFFSSGGWISLMASAGLILLGNLRFFKPQVLFEPPSIFKVGMPDEFPKNKFTFLPDRKVFIYRSDDDAFHAISAVCTHLGCTVKLASTGFDCPCHGSKFDKEGQIISGPPPRPLPWLSLTKSRDGQLVVNINKETEVGTVLKA